jgi:tryptophan halogenase
MKRIVILGGGTAGWLTALMIKKNWSTCDITVIEDPSKPPIIAGESGSFAMNDIMNHLDINFFDWIKKVSAMPKLGGKFYDWYELGSEFTHGAIESKIKFDILKSDNFKQLADCGIEEELTLAKGIPFHKLYAGGHLIEQNKVPFLKEDPSGRKITHFTSMYHFDSRANANYLKKVGMSRGINLLEKKYVKSTTNSDTGNIIGLVFDDATGIEGDWFFDCSGFARLLLDKVMHVEYEDHSKLFPASSVFAWWDEKPISKSYTEATAMKYGWSWNINIAHRAGNGYIYDGTEISLDQAIDEARIRFNKKIEPVASFSFNPCNAKEYWKGNVIGVGLSTGFVEPLESNGLGLVAIGLQQLLMKWNPESDFNGKEREMYNEKLYVSSNEMIDFLNLHYRGNRTDTSYWLKLKEKETMSKGIQYLLECYNEGIIPKESQIVYSQQSYYTVMQGLNLLNLDKIKSRLSHYSPEIFKQHDELVKILNHIYSTDVSRCHDIEDWRNGFHG